MAQGYHDFVAGEVLTAANLEDYTQNQTTMRFASAAARDTALAAVLTEGLRAYLIDLNVETIYSGSAWSTQGPVHGALTSWTPTCTQSATPTFTISNATYQRVGRWVEGWARLTFTATPGTANNAILVGIPIAAVSSTFGVVGVGHWFDSSAGTYGGFHLSTASTTTCQLLDSTQFTTTPLLGVTGSGNANAVANADVISYSFAYEAAADA